MTRIINKSLTAFLVAAIGLLSLASCVREQQPDNREKDYGYVQFKLYKEASYGAATKSVVSQLDYLSQAAKIKVNLVFGDGTISQTMTLGLAICDLTANVQPRGKVQFRFVKDFVPGTKASSGEYTFDEIKYVTLTVKKDGSSDKFTFTNIKTKFKMDFTDGDKRTSYLQCDTLLIQIS